jgi:hypothetical protein
VNVLGVATTTDYSVVTISASEEIQQQESPTIDNNTTITAFTTLTLNPQAVIKVPNEYACHVFGQGFNKDRSVSDCTMREWILERWVLSHRDGRLEYCFKVVEMEFYLTNL